MLIVESHRFWVGPEIAIKSIEHENAKESTKYCFLSKWLLSLSRKPTFQTFLQVLCGPWKMLKKAKDTVPFGEWCFQFFVRFWKDTNETFQKWQEKCTKTYLCEDYINFTTHELKTFCIEAYSVLGLCLHVHVICKVLSSPSPPQGYCGTSLCPWPWWDQALHSCEEGISVIELAVVFFCTEEEIYFILQPETDPNHKWASRWDYILDSMPHTKIQWFR